MKNPPLEININKIKEFIKMTLKSRVFKEAYNLENEVSYFFDIFETILKFEDLNYSYFVNKSNEHKESKIKSRVFLVVGG